MSGLCSPSRDSFEALLTEKAGTISVGSLDAAISEWTKLRGDSGMAILMASRPTSWLRCKLCTTMPLATTVILMRVSARLTPSSKKAIEKHQARVKQKEWAVVRQAMTPKAKAKAKTKAKSKAKTKAKAKAKASNKANISGQKFKTAKSSSSKVASETSRKIWHGALKKKRQDCPALAFREGDTHEKGNVLVEVPAEVEAVTPNPWQRRVVRRTHSVSSCPESARPAAQAEAAPEERPASVAEDNSTAPPEDTPASVADDRLRAQADLPPASHTQSPSKSTSNGHSDEPLPSSGASVIAASSSADDLAMAEGAGANQVALALELLLWPRKIVLFGALCAAYSSAERSCNF